MMKCFFRFFSEIDVDQLTLIDKDFILRNFRNEIYKKIDTSLLGFRR